MNRASFLPLVLVASCIPAMPGSWSGSTAPAPIQAPAARSAFDDDERDREADDDRDDAPSRRDERADGTRRDKPLPSDRQMKDLLAALEEMPRADRARRLGSLIDHFYLTVDHVVALIDPIPMTDDLRALDIVACSVVDPENAGRISEAVTRSQLDKAIAVLTQKCWSKFPHDSRPPGKLAANAAPPPGAYRLPGER